MKYCVVNFVKCIWSPFVCDSSGEVLLQAGQVSQRSSRLWLFTKVKVSCRAYPETLFHSKHVCDMTEMPFVLCWLLLWEPRTYELFDPVIGQSLKMLGRSQGSKSSTFKTNRRFPCLLLKMTFTDFFFL